MEGAYGYGALASSASSLRDSRRKPDKSSRAVHAVLATMTPQRIALHCDKNALLAADSLIRTNQSKGLSHAVINPLLCYNTLKATCVSYNITLECSFSRDNESESFGFDGMDTAPPSGLPFMEENELSFSSSNNRTHDPMMFSDMHADSPVASVTSATCTCGQTKPGSWCSHIVATILFCKQNPEALVSYRDVKQSVKSLSKEQLAQLLLNRIVQEPAFATTIKPLVASLQAGQVMALPSVHTTVAAIAAQNAQLLRSSVDGTDKQPKGKEKIDGESVEDTTARPAGPVQQQTERFVPPDVEFADKRLPAVGAAGIHLSTTMAKSDFYGMSRPVPSDSTPAFDVKVFETRVVQNFSHFSSLRDGYNHYDSSDSDDYDSDDEPDISLLTSSIGKLATDAESLWDKGEHHGALKMFMTVTDAVFKRVLPPGRFAGDGDHVNEFEIAKLLDKFRNIWLKWMVCFPYSKEDRMEWVQLLQAAQAAYCAELQTNWLGPAISAGTTGWDEVMSLLTKLYERKDGEEDSDKEEEEPEKEGEGEGDTSSRPTSSLSSAVKIELGDDPSDDMIMHMLGYGSSSDEDSDDDMCPFGHSHYHHHHHHNHHHAGYPYHLLHGSAARMSAAVRDTIQKKRKREQELGNAAGAPPTKKARSALTEPLEATTFRIEYLKERGFYREALHLMERCGITSGKESLLMIMGKSSASVDYALAKLTDTESLYNLAITLIDTHPYAAFEICSKALLLTSAAPLRGWDSYAAQDAPLRKLFDMIFLLIGVATPSGVDATDRHNATAKSMLLLDPLHGNPDSARIAELYEPALDGTTLFGVDIDTIRKKFADVVPAAAAAATVRKNAPAGSVEKPAAEKPATTPEADGPKKPLFSVQPLSQLCIKTMVNYFSGLKATAGMDVGSVIKQRFDLLAGTPAHVLRPIMLELAVSYIVMHAERGNKTWLFDYVLSIVPTVMKRSYNAGKSLYQSLPLCAGGSNSRGSFSSLYQLANSLYTAGEEMLALEVALRSLRAVRSSETRFERSDYHIASPQRVAEWIMYHYLGYDEFDITPQVDQIRQNSRNIMMANYMAAHGLHITVSSTDLNTVTPTGGASPITQQKQTPCIGRISLKTRLSILGKLIKELPRQAAVQVLLMKYCLKAEKYLSAQLDIDPVTRNEKKKEEKEKETEGKGKDKLDQMEEEEEEKPKLAQKPSLLPTRERLLLKQLQKIAIEQFAHVQQDLSLHEMYDLATTYAEMDDQVNALKLLVHVHIKDRAKYHSYAQRYRYDMSLQPTTPIKIETVKAKMTEIVSLMKKNDIDEVVKFCLDNCEEVVTISDEAEIYKFLRAEGNQKYVKVETKNVLVDAEVGMCFFNVLNDFKFYEAAYALGLYMLRKTKLWDSVEERKQLVVLVQQLLTLSVTVGEAEDKQNGAQGKGKEKLATKPIKISERPKDDPWGQERRGDSELTRLARINPVGKMARACLVAETYWVMGGQSGASLVVAKNYKDILALAKGLREIGCEETALNWLTSAVTAIINPNSHVESYYVRQHTDNNAAHELVEWTAQFAIELSAENKPKALEWAMWLLKNRSSAADLALLRRINDAGVGSKGSKQAKQGWEHLQDQAMTIVMSFSESEKILLDRPPPLPSRHQPRYTGYGMRGSSAYKDPQIEALQTKLISKFELLATLGKHAEVLALLLKCSNVWTPRLILAVINIVNKEKQQPDVQQNLTNVVKKYVYQYSWRHCNNSADTAEEGAFASVCGLVGGANKWIELYREVTTVMKEATNMPAKQPLYRKLATQLQGFREQFISAGESISYNAMVNYVKQLNATRPNCIKLLDALLIS